MNRPLWVAVDFDGTLCKHEFPEIGAPNVALIQYVRDLQRMGCILFLWTCRNHSEERDYLQEAIDWCASYGIIFDAVNENPYCDFYSRKIVADVYIDDRAMNPSFDKLREDMFRWGLLI